MTAKIKSLGVGFALVSTMTTTVGCVGPYNYYNSFSYIGDNQITLSTLSIEEKVKRVKYFKVEKYDCNSANQNVTAKNVYKVCKLINIVQNYMDTDDTDKMISVATRNEYGYLN